MNLLDLTFVIVIVGLGFWGFSNGLVGTAVWFVAVYASILVSTQSVGRILPNLGLPDIWEAASVPFLSVVLGIVIFWFASAVAATLNQLVNITPLRLLNLLGGAIFGVSCGIALVIATIVLLAVFTYVIPSDALNSSSLGYAAGYAQSYLFDEPRVWLDDQLRNSSGVRLAMELKPLLIPFSPDEIGVAVDVLESRIR